MGLEGAGQSWGERHTASGQQGTGSGQQGTVSGQRGLGSETRGEAEDTIALQVALDAVSYTHLTLPTILLV